MSIDEGGEEGGEAGECLTTGNVDAHKAPPACSLLFPAWPSAGSPD